MWWRLIKLIINKLSAIGFSFRYYVEDIAEHGNIKMLSLNGVYPDKNNIARVCGCYVNEKKEIMKLLVSLLIS